LALSLTATFSALPMSDGTTIIVDEATNTVQLKETVGAPASGTRTFAGLINVAAQPATLAGFGDLSLVTKAYASAAVSTETSRAVAAEGSIATNLSSELVARASADASIAAGLSTELVTRAAAVSTEISVRTSADASIAANLSIEKARIDAILVGASASADNFAEIVALINSVDTTNDTAFASYVLSNDAALSTELSTRLAADNSIAANLSTELVDRAAAVSTEASLRVLGDESIATSLSIFVETETNIRETADFSLAALLSAETSRATSTELSLSYLLGSDLTSETSRAMSVEAVLSSDLSAEISRATSAEASIATVLSTEVSSIIANTDLNSIDSFAEVVANLSTEVARAESVETSMLYQQVNTYAQHVVVNEVPDGSRTVFTFAQPIKYNSELIYMNGLLLSPGSANDYTLTYANGMVTGFTMRFITMTGDKLKAHGVYQMSSSLYE